MRTITPETKKILQEIAARLPQIKVIPNPKNLVTQKVNAKNGKKAKGGVLRVPKNTEGIPIYCRMLGEAMIQNNITLNDNEKIIPHKIYILKTGYLMVDHYKELKKAYLQTGDVNEYVKKIKEGD